MMKRGLMFGLLLLVGAASASAASILSVALCGPLSCTATVIGVPLLMDPTPQEFIWDFSAAPFVTSPGSNPLVSFKPSINVTTISPAATEVAHELLNGPNGTAVGPSLGGSSGSNVTSINLFPTYSGTDPQFTNMALELATHNGKFYTQFRATPTGTAEIVSASVTINFQPAGIPEPGTYLLMATGLAVCMGLRRRRNQKS